MAKGVKAGAKAAEAQVSTQVVDEQSDVEKKQMKRMMEPAGCRTYVRRRLATEFPEIVDGFVEEAKKGGCNHIKQAMELLKPVRKGTPRRKGSAERLLEKLRRE